MAGTVSYGPNGITLGGDYAGPATTTPWGSPGGNQHPGDLSTGMTAWNWGGINVQGLSGQQATFGGPGARAASFGGSDAGLSTGGWGSPTTPLTRAPPMLPDVGPSLGPTVPLLPTTPSLPQELPEIITPITKIRNTPIPIGRGKRRVNGRVIWRRGSRVAPPAPTVITPETPTVVVRVPINQNGPAPGAVRLNYNPYQAVLDGDITELDLYLPPLSTPWYYTNGGHTVWGPVGADIVVVANPDTGEPADTGSAYETLVGYSFGYRLDPLIDPGLTAIHANNMLIYDPTNGAVDGCSVTFYAGTEDQLQDPDMVAQDGATKTPAYRGMIYAVIGFTKAALVNNFNSTEPVITASFQDESFVYATEAIGYNRILGVDAERRIVYGIDVFASRPSGDNIHQLVGVNLRTGKTSKLVSDTIGQGDATHVELFAGCTAFLPWCRKIMVLHAPHTVPGWRVEVIDPVTGRSECISGGSTPTFDDFTGLVSGWAHGANGLTYYIGLGSFLSTRGVLFEYDPTAKTARHVVNIGSNYELPGGYSIKQGQAVPLVPGPDAGAVYILASKNATTFELVKYTPGPSGVTVAATGLTFAKNANEQIAWQVYAAWYRPTTTSWFFLVGSNSGWAKRRIIELVDPALATARGRAALDHAYADNLFDEEISSAEMSRFNDAIGDAVVVCASPQAVGSYRLINLDTGAVTTASLETGAPTFTYADGFTWGCITTGGLRIPIGMQSSSAAQVTTGSTVLTEMTVADAIRSVAKLTKLDPDDVVIEGLTDTVEGITLTAGIDPLDFYRNAGRIFGFDFFERGRQIVFKKIVLPTGDVPIDFVDWDDVPDSDRLPVDDNGSTVSSQTGERERPAVVELSYVDASIQFQASTARARSEATDSVQIERVQTAFIMAADKAATQAGLMLLDLEAQSETHEHRLPPKYLAMEPADVASFQVGGKEHTAKLTAVTIDADLTIRAEYRGLLTFRDIEWTGYSGEPILDVRIDRYPISMFLDAATRHIAGVPIGVTRTRRVALAAGSRHVTPAAVSALWTHVAVLAAATRSVSGVAIQASWGPPPAVLASGSRAVSGVALGVTVTRNAGLSPASRSVSGVAITGRRGLAAGLTTGSRAVTGVSITGTYVSTGPTNGMTLVGDPTSFVMLVGGTDFLTLL